MKKLFALLLALVFVLACFAGCTGNQNPSNDPGNSTPNQSSDAVDSPFTGHSDQTYYMVTFYPTLSGLPVGRDFRPPQKISVFRPS